MNATTYTDFQSLAQLRLDARTDARAPETLRKVASQFEALFVQMMLKSAREAKLGDGLFDSNEHQHYLEMFDAQIALKLAQGKGVGLADLIARQLGQGQGQGQGAATPPAEGAKPAGLPPADNRARQATHFAGILWPYAERAARELGVEPKALIAQAALETGWGRGTIRHADGRNSFNVFNIKATPDWAGERVRVPTLEYEDGLAVRKHAEFRCYGSYGEAFADYVRLLRNSPRYSEALAADDASGFLKALQAGGYATDPAYARKVEGVMNGAPLSRALLALKVSDSGSLT